MLETKEDHKDQQEKPGNGIKNKNEGNHSNNDHGDFPAVPPKKSIRDVASVQLSDREKIESGHKESDPSGISNRMQNDLMMARNISDEEILNE